jgi:integrase
MERATTLTDRKLRALKPASPGKRYEVMDKLERQLGVRVTEKRTRTFILVTRFPGARNPTRRALGEYPSMPLAEAREKAAEWRKLIKRQIDPKEAERRERDAAARARKNCFAAVAGDFIRDKLPGERKGREVARDIRRDLLPLWGERPVTEITPRDVREVVKAKRQIAPAQARNLLGTVKRLFAWAVDEDRYSLEISPAAALKPSKIVGEKIQGQRVLSDPEIFALWRAAERTPYPHGPVYLVLLLTALRLNEAADASWTEFDLANRIWTIPAVRMKGKNGKARPHAVPITDDLLAILDKLPRFKAGEFVFSTTVGRSPAWMSDKIKKRIDGRILRTLRALARRRGDDPAKVTLAPWVNHDIRRSVRSQLSRLKVTEEAREAVLAHARPGIKGTYDLHDYSDEKREALDAWAVRLSSIIHPASANMIELKAAQ